MCRTYKVTVYFIRKDDDHDCFLWIEREKKNEKYEQLRWDWAYNNYVGDDKDDTNDDDDKDHHSSDNNYTDNDSIYLMTMNMIVIIIRSNIIIIVISSIAT